jgi:hypothetical protein
MIRKIFLMMLLLCSNAFAAITDLKLSTAQIFDVQWNISGSTLNASGFNRIYASVNYSTQTNSAARWTAAETSDAGANGRYIGFFNSTTNPGTYGMAVFNSNGTRYKTINNTGSFRALADGAIFYNGNGMWGTLITTGQGYNLGQSGSWTVTANNPTNSQLQAYVPPSSTPLAAGQTAQPAGPPPPNWQMIRTNSTPVVISNIYPTSYNSPGNEGATNAFDGNTGTKYLNFDKQNAGVTVKLSQGRVVQKFTITTANDAVERDPASYKLYGSNDGVNWTLIQEGPLSLSNDRFAASGEIAVTNTNAYVYYFMIFPSIKNNSGNSVQIAELTYYYDLNDGVTSTDTGSGGTPSNPGTAGAAVSNEGPTVVSTSTSNSVSSSSTSSNTSSVSVNRPTTTGNFTDGFVGTTTVTTTTTTPVTTTTWSDGTTTTSNGTSTSTTNTIYVITPNYGTAPVYSRSAPNVSGNSIYIKQVVAGSNNSVTLEQDGNNNAITGTDSGWATLNGNGNILSIKQFGQGNITGVKMNAWGNNVDIKQQAVNGGDVNNNIFNFESAGNGNAVNAQQQSNNNTASVKTTWDINTVNITQRTGTGNASYATLTGNWNTVNNTQSGSNNLSIVNVSGDNNSATVNQTGTGHSTLLNLIGNKNTVNVTQTGVGDAYTLQQTCTNPAGCSVSIIRNK